MAEDFRVQLPMIMHGVPSSPLQGAKKTLKIHTPLKRNLG
jgi:hypothetical protein